MTHRRIRPFNTARDLPRAGSATTTCARPSWRGQHRATCAGRSARTSTPRSTRGHRRRRRPRPSRRWPTSTCCSSEAGGELQDIVQGRRLPRSTSGYREPVYLVVMGRWLQGRAPGVHGPRRLALWPVPNGWWRSTPPPSSPAEAAHDLLPRSARCPADRPASGTVVASSSARAWRPAARAARPGVWRGGQPERHRSRGSGSAAARALGRWASDPEAALDDGQVAVTRASLELPSADRSLDRDGEAPALRRAPGRWACTRTERHRVRRRRQPARRPRTCRRRWSRPSRGGECRRGSSSRARSPCCAAALGGGRRGTGPSARAGLATVDRTSSWPRGRPAGRPRTASRYRHRA